MKKIISIDEISKAMLEDKENAVIIDICNFIDIESCFDLIFDPPESFLATCKKYWEDFYNEMMCAKPSVPREASEMFHSANSAQNSAFRGLWVHSLKTSDKVLKYGENNKVDFSEHPTVVKRGSVRTINIYAAVPDVA